jgi:hypothetical protein
MHPATGFHLQALLASAEELLIAKKPIHMLRKLSIGGGFRMDFPVKRDTRYCGTWPLYLLHEDLNKLIGSDDGDEF